MKSERLHKLTSYIRKIVFKQLEGEITVWEKKDRSRVTNTDIAIQHALIKLIRSKHPSDNFIYEEGEAPSVKSRSKYAWVIDPIDGTENFIEKKKEFSTCIGLIWQNEFVESYTLFPLLGVEVYASKGNGVFINGKKEEFNFNLRNNHITLCSKTYNPLQSELQTKGYQAESFRCATYSMLQVLQNKTLLYHTINTMIYDVGPMSLALEESGAKIYSTGMKPIIFTPSLNVIPFFICTALKPTSTLKGLEALLTMR